MDRITVTGGKPLKGSIPISGAKNAALPLMIASLLTADRLTLKNVPNLADVNLLAPHPAQPRPSTSPSTASAPIPRRTSARRSTSPRATSSTPPRPTSWSAACAPASGCWARCSPAAAGARFLPGGCAIGTRPVDLH
jgi:UDP-N-acetylglucosamine 1-carboxyvinyltransferase